MCDVRADLSQCRSSAVAAQYASVVRLRQCRIDGPSRQHGIQVALKQQRVVVSEH
jgi:hypothetical protein